MISYGKRLLLVDQIFDLDAEFKKLSSITLDEANEVAKKYYNLDLFATSIVGKDVKPLR